MIRLSKLSDYAIVVLSLLAAAHGKVHTASSLAERTGIPEPTVAKVLKLLSRQGVIVSIRGVNGGYKMERSPAEVTVTELIVALEGPISVTDCATSEIHECGIQELCPLKGRWQKVNQVIKSALDTLSLADMLVFVPSRQKGRI
ncbi:MAG: SUF system Fe-S cluster assembly regulator [Alphaproteobacteria bacterium]|jgi:FeS assembly SUF system regulator|nr:SUF system Fe-S cluster assembly regulator [Alphaproteobacteria bacterium]MBP9867753.1 SUF system Fe-S cluster assembly regulator [Alphaproteobacteria bacterium]